MSGLRMHRGHTGLLPGAVCTLVAAVARAADPAASPELDEIVVTAQKKTELLQDVPIPIAVVSGEQLVQSNRVRIEDYYTTIPGLTLTPSAFGQPVLTIRGIGTNPNTFSNPTVGIVVDDVPFGSSTPLGGGSIIPDI